MKPTLEAREGVATDGENFLATSKMPWLKLEGIAVPRSTKWVRLVYETSLLEELCRPLLRFVQPNGHQDEVLPAALFGRGIWYGRIPAGTSEILISPTNQVGPFRFRVSAFQALSRIELGRHALARDPVRLARSVGAFLIGMRYDAHVELRNCFAVTPLARYPRWRAERLRAIEPKGLDRITAAAEAIAIHLIFLSTKDRPQSAEELLLELAQQSFQQWTLSIVVDPDGSEDLSTNDERVRLVDRANLGADLARRAAGDMVFFLKPGDHLPPYALAAVATAAAGAPAINVVYGDEECVQDTGESRPRLKPDWSPILYSHLNYLRGAVFFRMSYINACERISAALPGVLDVAQTTTVKHVRRILLKRAEAPCRHRDPMPAHVRSSDLASPVASIIIPTRDRAELLRKCVEGLHRSRPENFEVIVVDNSSTSPDALALLASLPADRRFKVISHPGVFNFSAMCNAGARAAAGSVLVLLNNDIEMIESDWLAVMLNWATRPEIGAVGAKLLYPDGRAQHSGVVLGMHGHAGHFERMLKPSDPGFFGTLCSPHEVSAVTGACLAVEKAKFDLIGGLDAENLPVDLNDIDLCLRLREAGFTNMMEPRAVLIHKESASRRSIRDDRFRYDKERRYFRERWQNALRDDPYFHPALSLYSLDPALG